MQNGREWMSGTRAVFLAGAIAGAALAAATINLTSAERADARQPPQASVRTLLTTSQTVVGEAIVYPKGAPAEITAAIITLPHGASTGWHIHGVPLLGYILDGELTVDYGAKGTRTYSAGQAFIEAEKAPHNGRNTSGRDVRVLAVYMGAEGVSLSHEAVAPRE